MLSGRATLGRGWRLGSLIRQTPAHIGDRQLEAAHARLFADAVRISGSYARNDTASRLLWRKRFVIMLSVVPVLLYWFLRAPVQMVVAGGIAQALMLPLIGTAAIYLRHRQLPHDVQPSVATTALLWLSTLVMAAFALYYVASRFA